MRAATSASLLVALQLVASLSCLAACEGTRLVVRSEPANLRVHRDARPVTERTPLDFEAPYFGILLLELESDEASFAPKVELVGIEPPVSPWFFPFDLPVEIVSRLLGDVHQVLDVRLAPRERRSLDEAAVGALVARARQAATER